MQFSSASGMWQQRTSR